MHVALVGDSVLDNGRYVALGEPDVRRQVEAALPAGSRVTLAAVDGATTADVGRQVARLPADVTHIVLSAGGNDAMTYLALLDAAVQSVAGAVNLLADAQDDFRRRYEPMLDGVLRLERPTVVCTIYHPPFPDPRFRRLSGTGLSLLNDVITRAAFTRGLPLLDLRRICDEEADFANQIEPSARGGAKIAAAIRRVMTEHDFGTGRSEAFV